MRAVELRAPARSRAVLFDGLISRGAVRLRAVGIQCWPRALECQRFHWRISVTPGLSSDQGLRSRVEVSLWVAGNDGRLALSVFGALLASLVPLGLATVGVVYASSHVVLVVHLPAVVSWGAVAGGGASGSSSVLGGATLLAAGDAPRRVGSRCTQCPFGKTSTLGALYCAACLASKAVQPAATSLQRPVGSPCTRCAFGKTSTLGVLYCAACVAANAAQVVAKLTQAAMRSSGKECARRGSAVWAADDPVGSDRF